MVEEKISEMPSQGVGSEAVKPLSAVEEYIRKARADRDRLEVIGLQSIRKSLASRLREKLFGR